MHKEVGLAIPAGVQCSRFRVKRLDIRRDRDRFNVFEVLIPGALDPGQELLDRPVICGSCVSVPDRDRKKLEEFFSG